MEDILRILVAMEINRIPKEISLLGSTIAPQSILNDIAITEFHPLDNEKKHYIQFIKLDPKAPITALLFDAMLITMEYSMIEHFINRVNIAVCNRFLEEYSYLFTEKYIDKLNKSKFINRDLTSDQIVRKMVVAILFKKRPNWLYDKETRKLKFERTEIYKTMIKFLNTENLPTIKAYQVLLFPEEQFSDTSKIVQLIGHPVFKKASEMRKLVPTVRLSGAVGVTIRYDSDAFEDSNILSQSNKNFINKTLNNISRNTIKTFINMAWEGVKMLPGSKFEYLHANCPEDGIEKSIHKVNRWIKKSHETSVVSSNET